MSFLPTYGTTLGPIGIPMADEQAFALDAIIKQLSAEDQRLSKASIPSALLNLAAGERADISWARGIVIGWHVFGFAKT